MISPLKSPHADESQPAQRALLNETRSRDAAMTQGLFATRSKPAKPLNGLAKDKNRMRLAAANALALRSRMCRHGAAETPSPAFLKTSRQKQFPSSQRIRTGLVAACLLTIPAHGSVTIMSAQYHVFGETPKYSPETAYNLRETADSFTKLNPFSGKDSYSASSKAWRFGAEAETAVDDGQAGASSEFVFTVDQPLLIIKFYGYLWSRAFPDIGGGVSYSLTENLTNHPIESQSWSLSDDDDIGGAWELNIEESRTYTLIPGTEYKLLLTANVNYADGSSANFEAILVPEPSPLLLLSFGGLCGLFYRRRA